MFARPVHPEKTLEELQALLARIEKSELRAARPEPVRAVSMERLDDKQLAELLARYEAGASANEIGLELGVAAASVMRIVRKYGLTVHDRFPSDPVVRKAIGLYESGLSLQRVADRIGYSKSRPDERCSKRALPRDRRGETRQLSHRSRSVLSSSHRTILAEQYRITILISKLDPRLGLTPCPFTLQSHLVIAPEMT